jgi:signal transduction histidine kinase/CheY-like chemotaxis protein/HPt (histidine-containing phosphotransfer) domain-containing protein
MTERSDICGRRADGSLFDAEASISHVELDGERFFAAILRDVSVQRQAARALQAANAQAEQAMRAKSLFLANMSHEIRTPLNAVIGMTTLLLGTDLSADQLDFVRTIRASGEALLGTINDVLDYSKAEVGKLELEQQVFDLRRCVEDALDLVAPRALEKRLNLAYLIEDDTPETLRGDPTRIRQILVNLLSNAVKFTHQGEVFVAVDGEPAGDGQHRFRIAVHDSGIGIAPEHLPRLFQSFSQVDASTTRKYGGTGLGLAICKRLAELMDGAISVQSEPGQGSVFQVTLVAQVVETRDGAEFLQRHQPALAGKRLLIVDANQTNRRVLTRLALRWGMLPSTLPSALEALDRVRHGESYDVVLIDARLPDADARDLAAEIQRGQPAVPLLRLTALGQRGTEPGDGAATLQVGPIKPHQLHAALVTLLQGNAATPPAPLPAAAPRASPLAGTLPLRVLVAEDNPVNQRVAVELLRFLGYQADLAGNGLEVIDAVERERYDVVLMDIQMPEMDGLQAARWIAQRRGASGLPRLIAMTANAMPGDREAYLDAGLDGYVAKPIELRALAAALQQAAASVPGAAAGAEVIDTQRLEHLHSLQDGERPGLVRELIDLFVADAPVHLDALDDALQHGDATRLASLAHRFLSASENIGARRVSDLCIELERRGRLGTLDGAHDLVATLAGEHVRARAALLAARERY